MTRRCNSCSAETVSLPSSWRVCSSWVLDAQTSEHLQADRYEWTTERQGYRNGYKPHHLTTRVGTLTLCVPQVRDGTFSTELFARYQRSEQALVLTLMEMVVNGVSTRKVARITEELCGTSFAKSTVSELSHGPGSAGCCLE
jgi:putative transposase